MADARPPGHEIAEHTSHLFIHVRFSFSSALSLSLPRPWILVATWRSEWIAQLLPRSASPFLRHRDALTLSAVLRPDFRFDWFDTAQLVEGRSFPASHLSTYCKISFNYAEYKTVIAQKVHQGSSLPALLFVWPDPAASAPAR